MLYKIYSKIATNTNTIEFETKCKLLPCVNRREIILGIVYFSLDVVHIDFYLIKK